jgi:hypothetical protein
VLRTALTVAVIAAVTTACGAEPAPDQVTVEGSHAHTYSSLTELATDSSAVVIVTATAGTKTTPMDEAGDSPYEATVTEVHVDKVLRGETDETTLSVRQPFTADMKAPEFSPLLKPDERYLLFVTPFEFQRGKSTGQWVITGDSGMYQASGDHYLLLSPAAKPDLPDSVSDESLDVLMKDLDRAS